MTRTVLAGLCLAALAVFLGRQEGCARPSRREPAVARAPSPELARYPRLDPTFAGRLAEAALALTRRFEIYNGAYFKIAYPGGDIPRPFGVCTDVVVRSYRALGIDLQKEVHEDMAAEFGAYPKKWGLSRPDANIDHRRVPNLKVFFARRGTSLPVTGSAADYLPGDIVSWRLNSGLPHIGIVAEGLSRDGERRLIVHNIGWGSRQEDFLFEAEIDGHYRYAGPGNAERGIRSSGSPR